MITRILTYPNLTTMRINLTWSIINILLQYSSVTTTKNQINPSNSLYSNIFTAQRPYHVYYETAPFLFLHSNILLLIVTRV